jgi:hypothetical protein
MQVYETLNGRIFMYESWEGWEDLTVTSVNVPSLVWLKKKIVRKAVLLRPTEKWILIYRSLEPTATCQLLVLRCFYGMRRCRRLKMAYFEQLVLIWFCKHLNCTLYGKHLCEILNISTQQQSISYLNFLHSFVAFHGTFWHSTQICSGALAFQYVY